MKSSQIVPIQAWFDGACKPQPGGHATWGAVVKVNGRVKFENGGYIGFGPGMTNNVAEYCGFLAMLEVIANYKGDAIVFGDSQLVINQMSSIWPAKKGAYVPYYKQAKLLLERVGRERIEFELIRSGQNTRCDDLAKQALAKHLGSKPLTENRRAELIQI
jgi:ribonuclease HI